MYHPKKITPVFLMLCLTTLLCLSPRLGMCQMVKGQSEISIGAGFQSDYELITKYTDGADNNYSRSPAFTCSYRYYLSGNFSLGLNFAYQRFVNYNADEMLGKPKNVHLISSYTFIAPEITFCYLNKTTGDRKNELRLYGLISAGIAINEGDPTSNTYGRGTILPAFQLTPIGVRFGRSLAGYMEAGFGNKGLINVGVLYRIPKKMPNKK